MWFEAMLSVYLCGIAAIISFVLGTAIGIWASTSEKVSSIIRPINDTLQTMPLFVIIIPFVMVFKIGEFTALLAIIAYSIVPSIRYAEHGLRNLSDGVLEAATMMGTNGLEQLVYIGLSDGDFGLDIVAGVGMAIIAIIVDRVTQAWSKKRQAELGLGV
jgi:glycine betaine/proline transport system permease protein